MQNIVFSIIVIVYVNTQIKKYVFIRKDKHYKVHPSTRKQDLFNNYF